MDVVRPFRSSGSRNICWEPHMVQYIYFMRTLNIIFTAKQYTIDEKYIVILIKGIWTFLTWTRSLFFSSSLFFSYFPFFLCASYGGKEICSQIQVTRERGHHGRSWSKIIRIIKFQFSLCSADRGTTKLDTPDLELSNFHLQNWLVWSRLPRYKAKFCPLLIIRCLRYSLKCLRQYRSRILIETNWTSFSKLQVAEFLPFSPCRRIIRILASHRQCFKIYRTLSVYTVHGIKSALIGE